MSFKEDFEKNLTAEERESYLVKLITSVGVNAEASILSDITVFLRSCTDLSMFSTNRLRSWLSFLRLPIPNYTAAVGQVNINFESVEDSDYQNVTQTIPVGTVISTSTGYKYRLVSAVSMQLGDTRTGVSVSNAFLGTATARIGTYSEFISIPAPNATLDGIRVYLKGVEVQPVANFVASTDSEPVSAYNGYYATVYDGILYVKIYAGEQYDDSGSLIQSTPNPEGQPYEVVYYTCDGSAANLLSANLMTGFVDLDLAGGPVFTVQNPEPIISGQDALTRSQLVNQLRSAIFMSDSVSSVVEYQTWYKQNAGVGDALVYTPEQAYVDWALAGGEAENFTPSRVLKTYLLTRSGNPVAESDLEPITAALAPLKDLSFIQYVDSEAVEHYYQISFMSSLNDSEFLTWVQQCTFAWYDPQTVFDAGGSLFGDFNLNYLEDTIKTKYGPIGLRLTPFHHSSKLRVIPGQTVSNDEAVIDADTDASIDLQAYSGEVMGGSYYFRDAAGRIVRDKQNIDSAFTPSQMSYYRPLEVIEAYNSSNQIKLYRKKCSDLGAESLVEVGTRYINVVPSGDVANYVLGFEKKFNYAQFDASFVMSFMDRTDDDGTILSDMVVWDSTSSTFKNLPTAGGDSWYAVIHGLYPLDTPAQVPVGLHTGYRKLFGVEVSQYE